MNNNQQEQIFSAFKPEEINQLLKAIREYYMYNNLNNDYDEYDSPILSPFKIKSHGNGLTFDLSFFFQRKLGKLGNPYYHLIP